MVCPRCTVAEIAESGNCALCGFSPAASVILKQSVIDEVQEVVQESTADRFSIQAILRLGERSLVYLAHEVAHDRLVALKVIPVAGGVTQQLAQRFERQAVLGQSLQHAHIVALYAFGTTSTFLWYTMEHMRGQSLGDLLRERGPLSLDRCLGIADQVASALDYAHRRGVPHANLKPSNIFLDDRWVRVSDFAILEAFGRPTASSAAGPSLRLPEYMAPEQFYARTAMSTADQYALAIIVYQCLTGTLPFIGDSFEEVARRQGQDAPPSLADTRKDLPVVVSEAVNRALSKQPPGRFPSVLDFVTALGAGAAPPVRRPTPSRRPQSTRRRPSEPRVLVIEPEATRRRRRWVLPLLGVVAVGAGATVILREGFLPLRSGDLRPTAPGTEPAQPPTTTGVAPPGADPVSAPAAAGRSAPGATAATLAPSPPPRRLAGAATAQPATLLVNSTPWGQLFIDGVFIGNTPRANLPVTPGRHLIRVAREGYEPFEREMVVEPGQVIRLTGIVLRPRGP